MPRTFSGAPELSFKSPPLSPTLAGMFFSFTGKFDLPPSVMRRLSYPVYSLNAVPTSSLTLTSYPSRSPSFSSPRWWWRGQDQEMGQAPSFMGTSDRMPPGGLYLFPPCAHLQRPLHPWNFWGPLLAWAEQKAGRKGRESGQGNTDHTILQSLLLPHTPPPPPPNTIPGLIFSNRAGTLVTPCHPPTRQEAGAVIHQLRGGIRSHPGPLSPSLGCMRPAG